MKYLNKFNESKKPSHEIRNIALKCIIAAVQRDTGGADFLEGYSDEDKQRVIGEIDKICFNLENKIKN